MRLGIVGMATLAAFGVQGRGTAPSLPGRLAFVRGGDLWVARPDGSSPHGLLPEGRMPVWSPDGSRLAFIRKGDAWVVRVADPRRARQVSHTGGKAESASWRSNDALFVTARQTYSLRFAWKPADARTRLRGAAHPEPEGFDGALSDILVAPLAGGPASLWQGTVMLRSGTMMQSAPGGSTGPPTAGGSPATCSD
jgi:dipeptidyl aminopeptidase/acylaminoacyl peptidase